MVFAFDECGACKTCEIACSYRFTGEFNHKLSALEVIDNPEGDGFAVDLNETPGRNGRFVCDGCKDAEEPFCLRYCHKREELRQIIEEYRKKERSGGC